MIRHKRVTVSATMLSKRLHKALADDPGLLANKLHSRYVYESGVDVQRKVKHKIDRLLADYDDDLFRSLAFNKDTRELIDELISCRSDPGFASVVRRFLRGMSHLLDREILRARKVRKPANVARQVRKELAKLHIYHRTDSIKVKEKKQGLFEVDYISIRHSPEHDGKFKSWRDTQFKIELNFNNGLFVWKYINVHKDLRGKGMGTKLVKFCERLAKRLGIRRFTVEWPNRKFWIKMGYEIPRKYRIGKTGRKNYTHEGYKELR